MPPKPNKDSLPAVRPEDCTQDVLVVVSVPTCRLQLGLLAAAELPAPEPLQDAAAAPGLHLELHCSSTPAAPVSSAPVSLSPDFSCAVSLEHMLKFRKGPDVIDRLINASCDLRLCDSSSRAVLATAHVDFLPFGLGTSIEDGALPWQPAAHDQVVKVGVSGGTGQGRKACTCCMHNTPYTNRACGPHGFRYQPFVNGQGRTIRLICSPARKLPPCV